MNWESLVERYGDRVRKVVYSIVRDEALSLDVAQEALLKIRDGWSERIADPEAWVLKVAGNAARDALRRRTRRREVEISTDIADRRTPDEPLLRSEDEERVARALQGLPERVREVLMLKFRDGLNGPQMAARLGCSLESAWQQLSRALKTLKSKVTEEK